MPRILLVKTSSLGDVVHNLPVASDLRSVLPEAEIHWVVEEAYAAVPEMHPAVTRVLPVALRRWRRSWIARDTRCEVGAFLRSLRAVHYDAVIDTQGLLKSALVARAAHGRRYGLDWKSSREPLRLFYDETFAVARDRHAVERNRSLAAQALGYRLPGTAHYSIRAPEASQAKLASAPYAVFLHATSAGEKLWPEERWGAIGDAFAREGVSAVLPWGTDEERARSERLAQRIPGAVAPPRLDLGSLASLVAGARCAIGVDTGLTHLAGALGVATVGIYTVTDPAATGLHACIRAANVGGPRSSPGVDEVMQAWGRLQA